LRREKIFGGTVCFSLVFGDFLEGFRVLLDGLHAGLRGGGLIEVEGRMVLMSSKRTPDAANASSATKGAGSRRPGSRKIGRSGNAAISGRDQEVFLHDLYARRPM